MARSSRFVFLLASVCLHFHATEMLRKSLGEVLVKFYPFAGRLVVGSDGKMVMRCRREGNLFVEGMSEDDVGMLGDISIINLPTLRKLMNNSDGAQTILEKTFADSADSVVGIGWDVLKRYVIVPIERGFGYVIFSKRFANRLRGEVQNLKNEVQRVEVLAEQARSNVRKFNDVFTAWEANAGKALEEARELLDEFEKATKTCCYGTLPDPRSLYQFSRKAEGNIEVINQLTQKCNRFNGLDISFIDPALGSVAASNPARREGKDVVQSTTATGSASFVSTSMKLRDGGVFESRALMIQNIMDALADNGNSVVGIYGMDIKRIQEEIAHKLGLSDLKNEEYVSVRAELLQGRLKVEERNKKTVLIILDNLWKGLDLKSVGIPCEPNNKVMGCKLLLTSRDRDVLRRDMGCDKDFHLGGLKEEEAKRLFERIVGDKVHDDKFKPWVEVALDKCAGVPFLIIAVAKRFKDVGLFEWKDTLKKIKKFKDNKINDLINQMLKWSYDRLEEDEKSLLQLCVVYGISTPSLENLVRYGVGLGLFEEVSSMEDARDRLSSQIRTFQASSLLLDSEDVDGFKIHDLVCEFVASVASKDHPLLVLKDKDKSITKLLKDKLKSCRAVCFRHIDMKEFPKELDCPELRIFFLFTNDESFEVLDSYFNSMEKLMVLTLTSIRLVHSPKPFQFLENLHTLCLKYRSLEDVAILGKLKGLQILSIVDSEIQRLPKEIGQLTQLRLLDLNYCSHLQMIELGVLGRLIKLEELYMKNSFNQWNPVEQTQPTNASLIELNHLKNLCTLHVSIPDPSALLEDLNVEKFSKFNINIGNVHRWPSEKGSSTLNLKLDPLSDILRKGCIQSILGKSDDLFLDGLSEIEQSICALSQKDFLELKQLQVKNSPSIHYILQLPSHTKFKMLESLILKNLINLEKISKKNITSKSFSALKVLRVESCDKMEVLFPLLVFHNLPNIKNFFAVGSSTLGDQVGTEIAFFNGQQVAFPNLENLYIKGIDNIKMIWHEPIQVDSFSKLKLLSVSECKKLVNIVPSFILGWLLSLETLTAKGCDSLEVVFKLQPPNPLDGKSVACSPLKELKLDDLPMLNCVWEKELYRHIKFHCLRSVTLRRCGRLASLFLTSIARDLIQLEELEINQCSIVELIEKEGLSELCINVEAIECPSHELKVASSFPSYFQHMKTLDVSLCDGLSNMFTSTIAENLVGLTKLRIKKCEILTKVISDEGGNDGHVVTFSQLKYMELDGLTRLRCFSSNGYTLMFPLLEDIIVNRCPQMKFFHNGQIEVPKLKGVKVGLNEGYEATKCQYFWKGNLNMTIQNMLEEMATFAGTKYMQLLEFPS
ncbi:probable disease resistance protein At4g27220 [Eucalyptus grandis]|uniref:probable disease resistance protein At4g27220 n=1 Tax=Eucalyptus grandis TaxID=71139 RepID=UPI00192EFB51|nr:probable disease resistance protein At4g27220 [Eucalyptus grandis]